MRKTTPLIVAPTGMQPGGYVRRAYADRTEPVTPALELEVERDPSGWRASLVWPCPRPVLQVGDDPTAFPDAAALLVPLVPTASWVTMGAPGEGVEGVLWRSSESGLRRIRAEGLGTVVRSAPPSGWSAEARWASGAWRLELRLRSWPALAAARRVAAAVWRGGARERAGLKSVTPDWIELSG